MKKLKTISVSRFACWVVIVLIVAMFVPYPHISTKANAEIEKPKTEVVIDSNSTTNECKQLNAEIVIVDETIDADAELNSNNIVSNTNNEVETANSQIETEIENAESEIENRNLELEIEFQKLILENQKSEFENAFWKCSVKTYGDWSCVTNTASAQWDVLHNLTSVCADGMLRDNRGYICAALGSYFGEIGSRWTFILENGIEIPIIKCDEKADSHTLDDAHTVGVNTDIIEFYIDVATHSSLGNVAGNGFVFSGNFNNSNEYNGTVVGWRYDGNIYDEF